jgi:hypothetical protein
MLRTPNVTLIQYYIRTTTTTFTVRVSALAAFTTKAERWQTNTATLARTARVPLLRIEGEPDG